jgi:3',5'-cyclic AMP phosphodiesterase CpdA
VIELVLPLRTLALVVALLAGAWSLFAASAIWVEPIHPSRLPQAGNAAVHRLAPGSDGPWSIVLLSDVQDGFAYLPEILERANRLDPLATLVLGDLSRQQDWEHLQLPVMMLRESDIPGVLFAVPGNHDVRGEAGRKEFVETFGATTFSVLIGDVLVLGLDNADGTLSDDPLRNLRSHLDEAEAGGWRVVLCLHRDLIDWAAQEPVGAEAINSELLRLIMQHSVEMVLTGHSHLPHEEVREATRFVVLPSSGDRSRDTSNSVVSFSRLEYRDGELTLQSFSFERVWTTELQGTCLHVLYSHLRPLFERSRFLFWSMEFASMTLAIAPLCFACRHRPKPIPAARQRPRRRR